MCEALPSIWLDTDGLHGYLLGRAPASARDRAAAARRYRALVERFSGEDADLWTTGLRQQIFLGDELFAERTLARATLQSGRVQDVPKAQRVRQRQLTDWIAEAGRTEEGLRRAYWEGGMTMTAMASTLGIQVSWVSRLIATAERDGARIEN